MPEVIGTVVHWDTGQGWTDAQSRSFRSPHQDWNVFFGREVPLRRLRVSSAKAGPPEVSLGTTEAWRESAPGVFEAAVLPVRESRGISQWLWLALGLALLLFPWSLALLDCLTSSGRAERIAVTTFFLLATTFSHLIGPGLPNPYNPVQSLGIAANGYFHTLDGFFQSVLWMALSEVWPSLQVILLFNQWLWFAAAYFIFRQCWREGRKRTALLLAAAQIFAPVALVSLTHIERSVTSALWLVAAVQLVWALLVYPFKRSFAPSLFAALLLVLAGGLKQENIPTAVLLAFLLGCARKDWRWALGPVLALLFWLGIDRGMDRWTEQPAGWRDHYLALNLVTTVADLKPAGAFDGLPAPEGAALDKIYNWQAMADVNSIYGFNIYLAAPREASPEEYGRLKSALLGSFARHPFTWLEVRSRKSCAFLPRIPQKLELHEPGVLPAPLLNLGQGENQAPLSIGALEAIFSFVQRHLSLGFGGLLLSLSGLFLRFAPGVQKLSWALLPHSVIVFFLSPTCTGFYWLGTYLWGTSVPLLAVLEWRRRKA